MKKINIQLYILFVGLMTLLASCSDFLELNNPSEENVDSYWNNKAEAEAMLAGCYNMLQQQGLYFNYYSACDPRSLDGFGTTDGTSGGWYWSPTEMALTWGELSASAKLVEVVWDVCYKGIARCNDVLYNVPKMGEAKIAKEEADRIVGEAIFLRAFFYNYLTSLYRDVSLSTEPTTTGYIEKSSKADIVKFITTELKEVAESEVLPISTDQRGRATRGAAWGLLAKIYLHNEMWTEAIDATKKVMEFGYALEGDYLKLFSEAGNTSKEVIFSVRFSGTIDGTENKMRGFLSCRNNDEFYTPIAVTNDLLDEYYDNEGKPVSESSLTKDELWNAQNRDPRWGFNFVVQNAWKVDDKGNWYQENTGRINKYQDYTVTEKFHDDQDYYVIRYADILLMRAEALANSGGSQTEIEGLINQVRDRASVSMPHVTAAEVSRLGGILNVVKHERRVEFAFEGHRYFDLKRWGEHSKLSEYNYIGADRTKVWPIPQKELDNNKALKQAPEWGGEK